MNFIYRILLGGKFFYKEDKTATALLAKGLKSGIQSVEFSILKVEITFNNSLGFIGWNLGKYHRWLSDGRFYNHLGELYSYVNKRPSAKVIWQLKKALEDYDNSRER